MKKRSFKVTTAFAGAAAATMGLGPAALAATALPASRAGSITNQRCSAHINGISHWVHLYYRGGTTTHVPECFGNRGWTTAGAEISTFCPGNNSGTLFFKGNFPTNAHLSANGDRPPAGWGLGPFGPVPLFGSVAKVSITGWTGHATCSAT